MGRAPHIQLSEAEIATLRNTLPGTQHVFAVYMTALHLYT